LALLVKGIKNMKKFTKILFIGNLLFFINYAYAEENQGQDVCDFIGSYARSIMSSRQINVPMKQLIKIIQKEQEQKEEQGFYLILEKILIDAYDYPRFPSDDPENDPFVKNIVQDFENKWYRECIVQKKLNKK
jgi:hypothetical protein